MRSVPAAPGGARGGARPAARLGGLCRRGCGPTPIDAVLRAARDEDRNGERGADGDGDGDRTTGGEDHGTIADSPVAAPPGDRGSGGRRPRPGGRRRDPARPLQRDRAPRSEASRDRGAGHQAHDGRDRAVGSGGSGVLRPGNVALDRGTAIQVAGLLPVASSAAPDADCRVSGDRHPGGGGRGTPHSGSTSTVQSGRPSTVRSTSPQRDRRREPRSTAACQRHRAPAVPTGCSWLVATATFRGTPALSTCSARSRRRRAQRRQRSSAVLGALASGGDGA